MNSDRIGIVIEQLSEHDDKFTVMWTTSRGIEFKTHIKDALMPLTEYTQKKVKERLCVFK